MQKGDRYYVIFSFKGIIHSSYLYSIHVYIITYGYTLLKLNKKRRTYSSPMIFSHLDTLWGGLWDSNPWPSGPQSDALTSWAKPAIPSNARKIVNISLINSSKISQLENIV